MRSIKSKLWQHSLLNPVCYGVLNIFELKLIDDDVDGETIEPKTEADVEEVQSPSSRDKRHIHIK